jgi:ubiquinone/menaquinone biosynthesis C-methylase UbiE
MDRLPAEDDAFDLVVAHGIWNLARSAAEMRRALSEAARVARSGAALFVFTFSGTRCPRAHPPWTASRSCSRSSRGAAVLPDRGALVAELGAVGFSPTMPCRGRSTTARAGPW